MTTDVVAEHFEDIHKQRHAARFGMWVFLVSEVLLFAGFFVLYWAGRSHYPESFEEGVGHNNIAIGTINTGILLTSSFFVALAVALQREGRKTWTALCLWTAAALGLVFLVLKGIEYWQHIAEGAVPGGGTRFYEDKPPALPLFFTLYFVTTGAHALHVIIGMITLIAIGAMAWRGKLQPPRDHVVEIGGLYWHLVDVIWIFLWPMFYLIREVAP